MNKYLAPILLLGIGFIIAGVSLYRAGIVGVMDKLGLESSNNERLFDQQMLAVVISSDSWWECKAEIEILDSVRYYLSTGEQRTTLGFALGERRIKCGVQMASVGREREAVYKIIRGGRYWESSLMMISQVQNGCQYLPDPDYIVRLEEIVGMARGSAKVTIGNVKERVQERMVFEQERCIDQE